MGQQVSDEKSVLPSCREDKDDVRASSRLSRKLTARRSMSGKSTSKTQVEKSLELIRNGSYLVKIRSNHKYRRRFMANGFYLTYTGSKKISWLRRLTHQSTNHNTIDLRDIQEIRDGADSDTFLKAFRDQRIPKSRCFSLIVGDKHNTLDLVADREEVKDQWISGLRYTMKQLCDADLNNQRDFWLSQMFKMADCDGDGSLNLKEIVTLMKKMNFSVKLDQAARVFMEANTNKKKNRKGEQNLDETEFINFYRIITRKEEIDRLFIKYDLDGNYLSVEELTEFFRVEQSEKLSPSQCEQIIDQCEMCPDIKAEKLLSIYGFMVMFDTPQMDIFNPAFRSIYQNMTRPINHYYIDSSHNTYLAQDQLVGPSKVESYIRALQMGCRCVEMDIWDGDDGDPVIYHGYTLTSKILFRDVIRAVDTYSFVASEYPVILSLENHCSIDQQELMAHYMKTILKDKLYLVNDSEKITKLPSPHQLRNKIVVKGKKLKRDEVLVSDEDEAAEIEHESTKKLMKAKRKITGHNLAQALSDCVVICQSVSFKEFVNKKQTHSSLEMSSLSENKAMSFCEDSAEQFIEHNRCQLSRIYPAGSRTDSSNYDPMPLWLCGCQIVALNYQTPDVPMLLNKGVFEDNGGCGYVLKPDFLISRKKKKFLPAGPYSKKWKRRFVVTIISGSQLPKKTGDRTSSILDPYVKVDIIGVDADNQSVKTEVIQNNGFHPVWDETFQFNLLCPQMALVLFRLMDHESMQSNVLIGQYCLPLRCLQTGYRTIHLKTKRGKPIQNATLLVHSVILDPDTDT